MGMHSHVFPRACARLLVAFSVVTGAHSARAQEVPTTDAEVDVKSACIDAFEQAQLERQSSHLVSAQKHLLACSQQGCGPSLMAECTHMYSEIDRALPSVVLSAHDEARDVDLTNVAVQLNGQPFSPSFDGTPIPIDPGEHEFVFVAAGHAPITRRVVIRTGDKYRLISIIFPAPQVAAPRRPAVEPKGPVSTGGTRAEPSHEVSLMPWVLGGVGVAGLGTAVTLRIVAGNDFDAMKQGCAARGCPESDIDTLQKKYLVSNVALGVGGAALAGAALWYLLDTPSTERNSITITPAASGVGACATARGRF
jgi:hypothetical protein